jgi:hypothetical protein
LISIKDKTTEDEEIIDERHLRHGRFKAEFPLRVQGAIFAMLSLVTPMLIMAINPSHEKTLITASVSVFVFGFLATLTPARPSGSLGSKSGSESWPAA